MSIDKDLWKSWNDAIRTRTTLTSIDASDPEVIRFVMTSDDGNGWNLPLRAPSRYVMGCDIVGYSGRSLEGQLYLTTSLFSAMNVAVMRLREIGWIPKNEPCAVLPTGDGALIVTERLECAFALTLMLNMLMEDVNRGPFGGVAQSVESQQPHRILPCEVRYAIARGRLVEIEDVAGRKNFIGEALVTCARILAASKGAHFLVDDSVIAEFLKHGGINEASRQSDPWNWGQKFHTARLQPRKVKNGQYCFSNVFGTYNSQILLNAVSKTSATDSWADPRTYDIGSHDVAAIV